MVPATVVQQPIRIQSFKQERRRVAAGGKMARSGIGSAPQEHTNSAIAAAFGLVCKSHHSLESPGHKSGTRMRHPAPELVSSFFSLRTLM